MENIAELNMIDLGTKARSKAELYKLLTSKGNLYLPPYKEWSIELITDYLQGKKQVIIGFYPFMLKFIIHILSFKGCCDKVNPQIDGLRSENLYAFIVDSWDGASFLPDIKKNRLPNRTWLGNICKIWFTNLL